MGDNKDKKDKDTKEEESEDEIDAVLKQIVDEDGKKGKKRKRSAKADAAPKKADASATQKPTVLCDWRSTRAPPMKEAVVEKPEAESQLESSPPATSAPEKKEEPAKEKEPDFTPLDKEQIAQKSGAELTSAVDQAFNALRNKLGGLQSKLGDRS